MPQKRNLFELEVLQELFLDQLNFKLRAIYLLFRIKRDKRRRALIILDKLETLTRENIAIIKKPNNL